MNSLFYSIRNMPKPILILIGTLSFFILVTMVLLYALSQKPTERPEEVSGPQVFYQNPPSEQTVQQASNYSIIKIGDTTEEEIKKLPGLKGEQVKGNQTEFAFKSGRYNDDLVITENGVVVFKKIVTVDPQTWQHPPLSSYLKAYGEPEAEFTGSNIYGSHFKTFVYPSKGIAFIGNPTPDELYEIQVFEPTTLEQYRNRWGTDINEALLQEAEGELIGR